MGALWMVDAVEDYQLQWIPVQSKIKLNVPEGSSYADGAQLL
jgi:hypothetical protein